MKNTTFFYNLATSLKDMFSVSSRISTLVYLVSFLVLIFSFLHLGIFASIHGTYDSFYSESYISSVLFNLIQNLKDLLNNPDLSLEERLEIQKEFKALSKDHKEIIKEAKAAQTKEQKIAKIKETKAKKKAKLQQFYQSSLYRKLCNLLQYDIKDKIKYCAFNSKWLKAKDPELVNPSDFDFNFYTYDVEAFLNNGVFQAYQFGMYHPDLGYKSFYGVNCIQDAFDFILGYNFNSNDVCFYAHNGGKFDMLFLIKELNRRSINDIITLIDKNNSIFMLQFSYNGINFKFLDSFKLMPFGLDKLLKDFGIAVDGLEGKLPFDHSWMNYEKLYYTGSLPVWLESYSKTLEQLSISTQPFFIQNYCEIYNKIDCIGLHKLIFNFFKQFSIDFNLNLTHCITLPQLVMELFRSKWLDSNETIRLLSDQSYNFIKEAYKSANVSVYKPYGEKFYAYDVNSLYPFCMKKDMPVGTPRPHDVSLGLEKLFGFAYAKVECPRNLKIPVLPVKSIVNGSEKLRTPAGVFKGVYFSEELKYAATLGYSIKLIKAVQFDRHKNLFHGFVDFFYDRKLPQKGPKELLQNFV